MEMVPKELKINANMVIILSLQYRKNTIFDIVILKVNKRIFCEISEATVMMGFIFRKTL